MQRSRGNYNTDCWKWRAGLQITGQVKSFHVLENIGAPLDHDEAIESELNGNATLFENDHLVFGFPTFIRQVS